MGLNKTVVILRVGSSGLMFQHRMAWKGSRSATCWTIQHYSSIIWCFEPFFFFLLGYETGLHLMLRLCLHGILSSSPLREVVIQWYLSIICTIKSCVWGCLWNYNSSGIRSGSLKFCQSHRNDYEIRIAKNNRSVFVGKGLRHGHLITLGIIHTSLPRLLFFFSFSFCVCVWGGS